MNRLDDDSKSETALGYLENVLRYMQDGGKLTSIEATASHALLLHGREMGADGQAPASGSLRAAALRESVSEMRLRHNSLAADAVFDDMEEQARLAGAAG
jgi:hypothetical protein